ncbi:MAG: 3-isopropylmalate dehydrogenase [Coriobacteriales bacterium]|nr:3-isopropylmalate dehydrogenase [Coriobacteriales bacterium]
MTIRRLQVLSRNDKQNSEKNMNYVTKNRTQHDTKNRIQHNKKSNTQHNIALLKGDGIGPEIVNSACKVLGAIGEKYGHTFIYKEYLAGGCAIDATGEPLPQKTIDGCMSSDSVLLGAVGGPKWDNLAGDLRPEKALLGIRLAMGLYSNLRPVRLFKALKEASPLRASIVAKGFDILIVRELTGGIYFGERGREILKDVTNLSNVEKNDREALLNITKSDSHKTPLKPNLKTNLKESAFDTERYSTDEIERIGRVAFKAAAKRRCQLTSVDKANVLESSRLWREVMHRLGASEYPQVKLTDMLVDNAAMQLIRDPSQFDVIVTTNMFGDILSDEASQLTGSIGMLPSSSLGLGKRGLYEPISGSAPDIAGRDIANPIATILSAAMMLRHSLCLPLAADAIEDAVEKTLDQGWRTTDIAADSPKNYVLGTKDMTAKIIEQILSVSDARLLM